MDDAPCRIKVVKKITHPLLNLMNMNNISLILKHIEEIQERLSSTPDFDMEYSVNKNQVNVWSKNYPATSACIRTDRTGQLIVNATSGSRKLNGGTGSPLNEILNNGQGNFLPNACYVVDLGRFIFKTDGFSRRVTQIDFRLADESLIDRGSRPRRQMTEVDGTEHGHGVPHCLGGPNEGINIFLMSQTVNRELLKHLEGFMSASIRLGDLYSLKGTILLDYDHLLSTRPSSFHYKVTIQSSTTKGFFDCQINN